MGNLAEDIRPDCQAYQSAIYKKKDNSGTISTRRPDNV